MSAVSAAEVVIIGAGSAGVNVALQLAGHGCDDIVVVDAGNVAVGRTTARCGGGIRYQFASRVNIDLSRRSDRLRRERARTHDGDQAMRRTGYLFAASDEAHARRLRASVPHQRRAGLDVRWLTPAEIAPLLPDFDLHGVLGGTWHGADGWVNAMAWSRAEIAMARRRGVRFLRGTPVTGVRASRGRVRAVDTAGGPLTARYVVNAAGPWASSIFTMTGHDLPVRAVVHQVCHTDAAPSTGADTPTVIFGDSIGFRFRNGALVVGATDDRGHRGLRAPRVSKRFERTLWARALSRVPRLRSSGIVSRFACLYDVTPDDLPLAGPVPSLEGMFCAVGFNGHGFMHAPAVGELVGELVAGRVPDPGLAAALAPARFTTEGA